MSDLTQKRVVANDNSEGAVRINNEEIHPSLRGYFRLPQTGTLMKFGGFAKTNLFVDTNQAGSYYGGYVQSSFPSTPQPHAVNATVPMPRYDRTSLRLCQFYAQYKNLLVGQTWSSYPKEE